MIANLCVYFHFNFLPGCPFSVSMNSVNVSPTQWGTTLKLNVNSGDEEAGLHRHVLCRLIGYIDWGRGHRASPPGHAIMASQAERRPVTGRLSERGRHSVTMHS